MARNQAPTELLSVDRARGVAVVRVDRAVYPLDAVYGAVYELLDRAYVLLASAGKNGVTVELRARAGATADLEALAGELANKLIDHALRVSLARKHGALRDAIVARALAGAGGAAPAPEPATPPSPGDDPFELAEDWQQSRETPPGRRS